MQMHTFLTKKTSTKALCAAHGCLRSRTEAGVAGATGFTEQWGTWYEGIRRGQDEFVGYLTVGILFLMKREITEMWEQKRRITWLGD